MVITTTELGAKILEIAESLLYQPCVEIKENNASCIKELVVQTFPGKAGKTTQPPYCAITQTWILDKAFDYFEKKNILRGASTTELLNQAKKNNIRVDRVPAAGAVFLARSGGNSPSGFHAGLVWYVNGSKIGTIEGNSSGYLVSPEDGCVKKSTKDGILYKERYSKDIPYFIHVEEYLGTEYATHDINVSTLSSVVSGLQDETSDENSCHMEVEEPQATYGEDSPDTYYRDTMILDIAIYTTAFAAAAIVTGMIVRHMAKNHKSGKKRISNLKLKT